MRAGGYGRCAGAAQGAGRGPGGPEDRLRRVYDKFSKYDDARSRIADERGATDFLEAVIGYEDRMDLLFRLFKPKEFGMVRLKDALAFCGTPELVGARVVPLLAALGSDNLGKPTCRAPLVELLEEIYSVPGLLRCIQTAMDQGAISDTSPIGWWLIMLAAATVVRQDRALLAMLRSLEKGGAASKRVAAELACVLAGEVYTEAARVKPLSLENVQSGPGGRHDNDHADFRSIEICPTSSEALCTRQPYLLRAGDKPLLQSPEATLLDRHFRLLREDMMQLLCESMVMLGLVGPELPGDGGSGTKRPDVRIPRGQPGSDAAAAAPAGPAAPASALRKSTLAPGAAPALKQHNVFAVVEVLGVSIKPRPSVMVAIQLPMSHQAHPARMKKEKDRLRFWDEFGKGTLPTDALVCLVPTAPIRRRELPLVFATVARRDKVELSQANPVVELSIPRGQSVDSVLQLIGCGALSGLMLVQVNTSFFAAHMTLSALKAMTMVPLAEEIMHGRLDDTDYLSAKVIEEGPPGTGKTHVGALVAETIVRRSGQTLLCVCYTNHALDQFLEALLDKGITDIVRVGFQSKSKRLKPYSMSSLLSADGATKLDGNEWRRLCALKDRLPIQRAKIQDLEELLVYTSSLGQRDARTLPWRATDMPPLYPGAKLLQQLQQQQQQEKDGPVQHRAHLTVEGSWLSVITPPGQSTCEGGGQSTPLAPPPPPPPPRAEPPPQKPPQQPGQSKGESDGQGTPPVPPPPPPPPRQQPGQSNEPPAPPPPPCRAEPPACASTSAPSRVQVDLWMLLGPYVAYVDADGDISPMDLLTDDIWQLSGEKRAEAAVAWMAGLRSEWMEDLATAMLRCQELDAEIRQLNESSGLKRWQEVLECARVIGCTTTAAAKYKDLLQSKGCAPGVVMVEEAGEVLEAHVLTSLSPVTKHLIMIGDHKQLRPKVESWPLQVQSGSGLDLNVSVFERLVLGGLPHASLGVQHRMHPDISRLVCPTYKQLDDHPSVSQHPPVLGLEPGRRVVFVNHNKLEDQEEEGQYRFRASASSQSKVNRYEVAMTLATVKYLLQQGYQPTQLVVLTPYLGQLMELTKAMRSQQMQVLLGDLDVTQLVASTEAGALQGVLGSTLSNASVRLSTIDNYQGEEADVVVASLVRSNLHGSVGFLREPEHINVLLSRARHGLILVSNAECLLNAKSHAAREHWGRLLGALNESKSVLRGLPSQCHVHGTKATLDSPAAFLEHAPQGGCHMMCGQEMPCGHTCQLRCHPTDQAHEHVLCSHLVNSFCIGGHLMTNRCSNKDVRCAVVCPVGAELQALDAEAGLERRAAQTKEAVLRATIPTIARELLDLEVALRTQQAGMQRDLETRALARTVILKPEAQAGAAQRAAREEEQRQRVQAVMKRIAAANQAKQATMTQLAQLEKTSAKKLQDIKDSKERMQADAADAKVSLLKEGIAAEAHAATGTGGADALTSLPGRLKALLAQRPRFPVIELDVLFRCPGLGIHLGDYCSTQVVSRAKPAGLTTSLKANLEAVLAAGEKLHALAFFKELAEAEAAPDGSAHAYLALCRAVMSVELVAVPVATQQQAPPAGDDVHPASHLAASVTALKQAKELLTSGGKPDVHGEPDVHGKPDVDVRSVTEQATVLHALAAGRALACILHPATVHLPAILTRIALEHLSDGLTSLGEYV
ncbi:hypothetical protein FOA52_002578 [Chlamydomonas sp. UWO 241]|nr:hypothetical protein FOA52_002578 [Chlamydomonas sp. UWO 241]